jgi:hypothetical protein
MRVAQYRLPKAPGDTEDASLVLYYFRTRPGRFDYREHRSLVAQMNAADAAPLRVRRMSIWWRMD